MIQVDPELLSELTSAHARLPNKTLFQLALAGLRVRLARSLVTLLSVVLAIAYLSYSGVNNSIIRTLASEPTDKASGFADAAETIHSLLREAGVNIEETRKGNVMEKWLVAMALITCMVGIANAMLMSVTERFREIGTMKCLGAEDNMVVKLFLIESALLGVVGSIIGVVVGLGLAAIMGFVSFGTYALTYFPVGSALMYCIFSFATGIVLCLFGAGYPAFVAARMRPVEALRVEE